VELKFEARVPVKPTTEQPGPVTMQRASATGPIVVGIAGLLGIATGVTTGILARGQLDKLEERCPNAQCPRTFNYVPTRTNAKTFGSIADVSFIAGGTLLVGAAVWYLLLPQRAVPAKAMNWSPTALCTGTGCAITLERGF
jgi:hypothetical protein